MFNLVLFTLAIEVNCLEVFQNMIVIVVGYPIRQFEMMKDGEKCWVDEQAIDEYTHAGYKTTSANRMSYCPPEWIAGKQGGGILLLDDWNRADPRFIQATMELIDRQQYVSWKLPADWHIILTSNPDNGEYLVSSLDPAQRTRFIGVELKFDIDVWARWAERNLIDGRCINFLIMYPELMTKNVNARSVTTFFNSISSLKSFEDQLPLIKLIGEGSVGDIFSTQFVLFINNKMDKIISPSNIFTQDESYVLGTLKSLVGKNKSEDAYRADIACVISTRITNYLGVFAKDNPITKEILDRMNNMVDQEIFSNDVCYNLIKDVYNSHKSKFKGLLLYPKLVKFITQ